MPLTDEDWNILTRQWHSRLHPAIETLENNLLCREAVSEAL
jgi:hypothetical protein